MNKKIKRTMAILCTCTAVFAGGCTTIRDAETPTIANVVSVREAVLVADPQAAIDAIYASLKEPKFTQLDEQALKEHVGIDAADLTSFFVCYSDPTVKLSDVFIVEPGEGKRDAVRETLYQYKEQRVQEFKNYDILGAYEIAQNAIVYDQGNYVILLMLEDTEAARTIIDNHIPQ